MGGVFCCFDTKNGWELLNAEVRRGKRRVTQSFDLSFSNDEIEVIYLLWMSFK